MLKTFLAGATALAIAGGAYAYEQQSSTVGAGGEFQRVHHSRLSAEDISAFGDARLLGRACAALKLPSRRNSGRRSRARCAISPSSAPSVSRRAPTPTARRTRSSA